MCLYFPFVCVCVCVWVCMYTCIIAFFYDELEKKFHKAVSPIRLVSYSHTVLSRFTIKGVSTVTSSSTRVAGIQCLAVLEFKWCIAICDGGGGGGAVCKLLIWTCGICRTLLAIVPPYVVQWCAAIWPGCCRGSVHVVIWFWNAFWTGLCNKQEKD